jgi:hypothetical protein
VALKGGAVVSNVATVVKTTSSRTVSRNPSPVASGSDADADADADIADLRA